MLRFAPPHHTTFMRRLYKSLDDFQKRFDYNHARFMKELRRLRYSLFGLLSALLVYSCILPFANSPSEIIITFSFFLIFASLFIYLM